MPPDPPRVEVKIHEYLDSQSAVGGKITKVPARARLSQSVMTGLLHPSVGAGTLQIDEASLQIMSCRLVSQPRRPVRNVRWFMRLIRCEF